MKTILAAAAIGLALTAAPAFANSDYHDETTSQHVGRTTVPAMGAKASVPADDNFHDENTSQHVGRTTVPAMGAKTSVPVVADYHDENTATHIVVR
jgi:hypothetical protein